MTDPDLDQLAEFVRLAAAREILPRYRNLGEGQTLNKTSAEDLVTVADKGMEVRLTALLSEAYPQAEIIGEEGVFEDPALLDRIAEAELCFILDPIDGTWNFAHGLPVFGVIVAVVRRGETIGGLIVDPLAGDHVCAMRGGGAWRVSPDGRRQRLSVAASMSLPQMSGYVGLGLFPGTERARLSAVLTDFVRVLTLRCSAFEYRMLAQGSMHFSFNAHLKPWDHAAGQLIHTEAGGFSALISGQPYAPTMREGRFLLAPDVDSWRALADLFGPTLD